MRITILTQPEWHPFHEGLRRWLKQQSEDHEIAYRTSMDDLPGGDILFIMSFLELVPRVVRDLYSRSYVAHASALPNGRGWSPMEWQILDGAREITTSLILAEDKIDSGAICCQATFEVEDHELRDEIETKLFEVYLDLMTRAIDTHAPLAPRAQVGDGSSYPRRTPADSKLDPSAPLDAQFDILRIADSRRFPAFVDIRGHRYHLQITKAPRE